VSLRIENGLSGVFVCAMKEETHLGYIQYRIMEKMNGTGSQGGKPIGIGAESRV
jgi:hypothetical protein